MQWFIDNWEILLVAAIAVTGNALSAAAVIAKLTPTTTDDEWIAKIEERFNAVAKFLNRKP